MRTFEVHVEERRDAVLHVTAESADDAREQAEDWAANVSLDELAAHFNGILSDDDIEVVWVGASEDGSVSQMFATAVALAAVTLAAAGPAAIVIFAVVGLVAAVLWAYGRNEPERLTPAQLDRLRRRAETLRAREAEGDALTPHEIREAYRDRWDEHRESWS